MQRLRLDRASKQYDWERLPDTPLAAGWRWLGNAEVLTMKASRDGQARKRLVLAVGADCDKGESAAGFSRLSTRSPHDCTRTQLTDALPTYALDLREDGSAAANTTWVQLARFPGPLTYAASSAAIGQYLYIFGGWQMNVTRRSWYQDALSRFALPLTDWSSGYHSFRAVHRYDGATDTWSRLADLPFCAEGGGTVVLPDQRHILLLGSSHERVTFRVGKSSEPKPAGAAEVPYWKGYGDDILCYDAVANTWSRVGVLPYGVVHRGGFVSNGTHLLGFGGEPTNILNNNAENFVQVASVRSKTDDDDDWSGPALTVRPTGPDGLPQLTVDGEDPQPPLWLVLHLQYSNMSVLDEQVRRAADAGLRTVCLCLTSDVWSPKYHADPWMSDAAPMTNQTRGVFDRIVRLHPRVVFIVRFYAFQPGLTKEGQNIVMLNMTDGDRECHVGSLSLYWLSKLAAQPRICPT